MRKSISLIVALIVCLSLPLTAQELPRPDLPPPPPPPKPLGSEWDWMIGEWEGWTESPMGKSKEWEKIEYTLDRQFLMIQALSEQDGKTYKGGGMLTVDLINGGLTGFWFDNQRAIFKGEGKREGDKIIMDWSGPLGESTRITEKISDDEYTVVTRMTGPDKKKIEMKTVMKRIKKEKK